MGQGRVFKRKPEQRFIIAVAAIHEITKRGPDCVVAVAAFDDICPTIAAQQIITIAAIQEIVAKTAFKFIITCATADEITSVTASDGVITVIAKKIV